jgi:hypothetical protein
MTRLQFAGLALLVISTMPIIAQDAKPTLSKEPLINEQIEVYRTFLRSYTRGNDAGVTNLANRTSPLDFWPSKGIPECLHGIEFEGLRKAGSTIHIIDSRVIVPGKIVLVNPEKQSKVVKENDPSRNQSKSVDEAVKEAFASGMLTLSEISFDKTHHYAVMSFGFVCGMLCGNGRTIVFEKIKGKWRETQRQCDGWIS